MLGAVVTSTMNARTMPTGYTPREIVLGGGRGPTKLALSDVLGTDVIVTQHNPGHAEDEDYEVVTREGMSDGIQGTRTV